MALYQTEIEIPDDRVVVLFLPDDLPTGRATLTITPRPHRDPAAPADDDSLAPHLHPEPEHHDIEWWIRQDES